ncbi:MAG: CCA tRNA nucleotidyltransferase, partial [Novosphingobium sp.]
MTRARSGPIAAAWLSAPATQAVFEALERGGYGARAVGGIVRNTLLDLPATDIDIATDALPEDTLRLAAAAGLKTIPTGLAHGTVTVISGGAAYEVTTLRRDVSTDGRHAEVAFTADWAADAARRDFTINALYCDRHGEVFDPLGGLADLDPVQVRFIGNAGQRIEEDYLRILRFFRFTATYVAHGVLDPAGLAACTALRGGLARISGERIQAELLRLLAAPHAVGVTRALIGSGVFAALFDVPAELDRLTRMVAIEGR